MGNRPALGRAVGGASPQVYRNGKVARWFSTAHANSRSILGRLVYKSTNDKIEQLKSLPPLERSAERNLVGVLQIAAHRQAAGQAGELHR
jgi:hypothetical protein